MPDVCECKPGYYTHDLKSILQCNDSKLHIVNCKEIFGALCESCTSESCTSCSIGSYLKETTCSNINIESCTDYSPHCIECDQNNCILCHLPYIAKLENAENICDFGGYLEFSSRYYDVLESEEYVRIEVIRYGGYYGDISVYYNTEDIEAIHCLEGNSHDIYVDYARIKGELKFKQGEDRRVIEIPVFRDLECGNRERKFRIVLYDTTGGAIISKIQSQSYHHKFFTNTGEYSYTYAIVEIYDDISIPDISATIVSVPKSTLSGIYTYYTTDSISISIQSYIDTSTLYTSGGNLFIADIFRYDDRSTLSHYDMCYIEDNDFSYNPSIYSTYKFTDNSNGKYDLKMKINSRGKYFAEFYLLTRGIEVFIWNNNLFEGNPIYRYISYSLGDFSPVAYQPGLKFSSVFKAKYVPTSDISYSLSASLPKGDSLKIFIGDEKVLDCIVSCLSDKIVSINGGKYYEYKVEYIHITDEMPYFSILKNDGVKFLSDELFVKGKLEESMKLYILASYNTISLENSLIAIQVDSEWKDQNAVVTSGKEYIIRVVLRDSYSNIILPTPISSNTITIQTPSKSNLHSLSIHTPSGCYTKSVIFTEAGLNYVKLTDNRKISVQVKPDRAYGSKSVIKYSSNCKINTKCVVQIELRDKYGNITDDFDAGSIQVYYINTQRELLNMIEDTPPYVEIEKTSQETGSLEAYYELVPFSNNKATINIIN
jgi:hypothetical protein